MTLVNHKIMAVLTLSALVLSGCTSGRLGVSQTTASKNGMYKIGNPYEVMGQNYTPHEDYEYVETGMSSWYGTDFHAKYTANGEVYDMNTLTAAHRTLPLPSIVRVTNLENGRSLVLRVNDRGPFVKNRIIDVSKRAAQLLGYQAQGTAKVKVEVLAKESKTLKEALLSGQPYTVAINSATPQRSTIPQMPNEPMSERVVGKAQAQEVNSTTRIELPSIKDAKMSKGLADGNVAPKAKPSVSKYTETSSTTAAGGQFYVQAGSFANKEVANNLKTQLHKFGSINITPADVNGSRYYRVRVGPFYGKTDANIALLKIKDAGLADARVIIE